MLAVFGLALVLTNSRSSIMGLVAAMAISWFFTARIGAIGMLIAACVLSLFGVVIFYPGLQDAFLSLLASLFARSGHVAELTTFTGRQQIWEASWRLIQMAPWIGYGMSSVAIVLPRAHSDEWGNTVATAHNSLLESLISVGWLGTLPLILVVILAGGRLGAFLLSERRQGAGMEANQDLALCGLRFLVMMLVQGFSEKAFAGHPGSPFLALGGVVATAIYIRGVVVQRKSTSLEAS
jgi:O-antigen ligase